MAKKKVEEPKQEQVSLAGYVPNLQKKYKEEIVAKLQKEFGFATVMQVPKLVKITLNQGIGDATGDKKLVEVAQQELTAIAGQKAQLQTPPWAGYRSEGDSQRRAYVRVPRKAYRRIPSPYQRLQRYQ